MGKKSKIIVIDEYGDGVPVEQEWKDGKWCQYLNPENKRLLNLDYLSALALDSVVTVSIHPDLVDMNTSIGLLKDCSRRIHFKFVL